MKHKDDSFHGIGIYALDKGHMNDVEWLKRVMEKLRNMCEGRQPVAPGCEGVVSLAKEEDCWSTVKLSGEIVEGADVEVRKLVLYYNGTSPRLSSFRRHRPPLLLGRDNQSHTG